MDLKGKALGGIGTVRDCKLGGRRLQISAVVPDGLSHRLTEDGGVVPGLALPGEPVGLDKGLQAQSGGQGEDQQHHHLLHQGQRGFAFHAAPPSPLRRLRHRVLTSPRVSST